MPTPEETAELAAQFQRAIKALRHMMAQQGVTSEYAITPMVDPHGRAAPHLRVQGSDRGFASAAWQQHVAAVARAVCTIHRVPGAKERTVLGTTYVEIPLDEHLSGPTY